MSTSTTEAQSAKMLAAKSIYRATIATAQRNRRGARAGKSASRGLRTTLTQHAAATGRRANKYFFIAQFPGTLPAAAALRKLESQDETSERPFPCVQSSKATVPVRLAEADRDNS